MNKDVKKEVKPELKKEETKVVDTKKSVVAQPVEQVKEDKKVENPKVEDPKVETKNEKEQIKKEKEYKTVELLKKGDYQVHILVAEIRLEATATGEDLPFPCVKIGCFGKERRTQKLSTGCLNYSFIDHFYYEKNNLSTEELDSEKIVIEVMDSKRNKRKDYFGIYEFDFTFIYNNPNHCLNNFWITLANPESDDITKVRGYLKLSSSILHEKDQRVELNYKSTDDPNSMCLVPPQVKMSYKQLVINIIKAKYLPDMDKKGANVFIIARYLGYNVQTSIKDTKGDENECQWDEAIYLPVIYPVVSQKIIFEVWDKDWGLNKNDIIGSFELNIDDIGKMNEKFQYIHIYGSPLDVSGNYTDKMNKNPEIGSFYKGRILMNCQLKETESAIKACKPINKEEKIKMDPFFAAKNLWSYEITMYDALFLPKKKEKYNIVVSCDEKSKRTKFSGESNDSRSIKFNVTEDKPQSTIYINTVSDNVRELSDVFIYLNYDGKDICFQRITADTFYNNSDIIAVKLLPDPSIGKIDDFVNSGLITCRIKLTKEGGASSKVNVALPTNINKPTPTNESESEEDEGLDNERLANIKKNEKKASVPVVTKPKYVVFANIHMSRHLLASDSNGTSDPYVVISLNDKTEQTSIKFDTINCVWNESLFFDNVDLDIEDNTTWPVLFLKVMDHEKVLSDEMMAYTYIWISNSSFMNITKKEEAETFSLRPKWHQLHLPQSNRAQGQLLCSFYLIEKSKVDLIEKVKTVSITPETSTYSCEVNILGLRNLKPLSIIPVKKAFISIDLNSINMSKNIEKSMKLIKTQPKQSGPNPTINTVMKFDVKLPKDEIFMPDLQCVVYDYALSGMLNQMLGVFVIPLNDIIKENKRQYERDMKVTEKKFGLHLMSFKMTNNPNQGVLAIESVGKDKDKDDVKVINTNSALLPESTIPKEKRQNYTVLQEDQIALEIKKNNPQLAETLLNKDARNVTLDVKAGTGVDTIVEKPNINIAINKIFPKIVDEEQPIEKIPSSIIIQPVFKKYSIPGTMPNKANYREYEIEDKEKAPKEHYESIGYNDLKSGLKNKHYRLIYDTELESDELGFKSPFYKLPIKRGKFVEQVEEADLFDSMKKQDNKILNRFPAKSKNKDKEKKSIVGNSGMVNSIQIKENDGLNKYLSSTRNFGDFKGLIRMVDKNDKKKYDQVVESLKKKSSDTGNQSFSVLKDFKYLMEFEDISKRILVEKEVVVRVYVLKLGGLKNMDENFLSGADSTDKSDPYIKIHFGDIVKDESKFYKTDKTDCDWLKYYDFPCVLPGSSVLKLEVWDHDTIFSDDLIGSTEIDIEDRYFSTKWRNLQEKPIERRKLFHPDYEESTGWVSMWVEIFDRNEASKIKLWNITPAPPVELEMRLIVWGTENTPVMDVEDMSDYYISCFIDSKVKQSTDVHFRCEKGNDASFNWRIVLPIHANSDDEDILLNINLMDNDFFSPDDYAAGNTLNLRRIVSDVYQCDVPIKFNKEYYNGLGVKDSNISFDGSDSDKFWFVFKKPKGDDKETEKTRVQLSLEIMPLWKAQICKVGKGRDEPNCNPYLPPPVGRFKWSLNPFSVLNQCVGAKYRRKMYCFCCMILVVLYLVFVLPYIILHLTAEAVNPFNKK